MYSVHTSKLFREENVDTTPEYVKPNGSGVLWVSDYHHVFLVKSIFASKTMWPVRSIHTTGGVVPSSNTSNYMLTL